MITKKPKIEDGAEIIRQLLKWLELPKLYAESMKFTPERVAKMYIEIFDGVYAEPPEIKVFPNTKETYVAVSNILFASVCEHHLLPFTGVCGVVYHAVSSVVGLSKIPRVVKYWASRPQLQERLTEQIAQDIFNSPLQPKGVYVEMSAEHTCMTIRGIKSRGSITNTSTIEGDIDKYEAHRLLHSDRQWRQ